MTNKINEISKEKLQELTLQSNSLAEILRKLELYVSNGNYRPLKIRLDKEGIDYTHIKLGLNANKGKSFPEKQILLSEIMIENSSFNPSHLKKRLIKDNILENKCSKCYLEPIWNNEKLVLQLDHINGNSRDHRLENLRMLCPNCHSQTSNYSGKNSKKEISKPQKYCICGKTISRKAVSCRNCASQNILNHPTKIVWPDHDKLLEMVTNSNYIQVAKILGVSDVSVRKRILSK